MSDYMQINDYSNKGGVLAISRSVFESIALDATNRVIGVEELKRNKLKIHSPIKVVFKKNGQVGIKVGISLRKGMNPTTASYEIQKAIAHDLSTFVESVPFDIEVSVDEIK